MNYPSQAYTSDICLYIYSLCKWTRYIQGNLYIYLIRIHWFSGVLPPCPIIHWYALSAIANMCGGSSVFFARLYKFDVCNKVSKGLSLNDKNFNYMERKNLYLVHFQFLQNLLENNFQRLNWHFSLFQWLFYLSYVFKHI
jgi:hypothetical protein